MPTWVAYCDAWKHSLGEEAAIRASRAGHDALSHCLHQRDRLLAEATARLSAQGEEALAIERALTEASVDSPEHRLALAVLEHRKQFPRRYLPALVRASARHHHTMGAKILTAASAAYGREAVLTALLGPAEDGLLSYSQLQFLLYYVRDAQWSTRKRDLAAEHGLVSELIRIASSGTLRSMAERRITEE